METRVKQPGKDFTQIAELERRPVMHVMDPWLRLGGLAMLYAPRGAGKTFLAWGIALAAAYGRPFLGWRPSFPVNVLYLDGEMGHEANSERMERLANIKDRPSGAFRVVTFEDFGGTALNLADRGSEAIWNKLAEPYDFLIIDNLATCVRPCGREGDIETWARVQANAIRQREAGKTVLFVHHAGKSGEQRGTSTREDCLDTVIALKPSRFGNEDRDCTAMELHFQKARHFYGQDAAPLHIAMRTSPQRIVFEWELLSVAFSRAIANMKNIGLRDSEIGQILGVSLGELKKHGRNGKTGESYENVGPDSAETQELELF